MSAGVADGGGGGRARQAQRLANVAIQTFQRQINLAIVAHPRANLVERILSIKAALEYGVVALGHFAGV